MTTILIGLDDTDNETSRGTGHLARMLSEECERRGMRPLGVTRHQFLLDSRIPFTSHNSGACVAVAADDGAESAAFAFEFVAERAADGSDPGVCIAEARAVPTAVIEFGRAATNRIVTMGDAFGTADAAAVQLRGLGGSELGVIGALGSVGLRAEGNEGRFIDLPGLRELRPRVALDDIRRLGIAVDCGGADREASSADACDTLEWVRPRLVGGAPVLALEWSEQRHAWIPADRKKSRPLE